MRLSNLVLLLCCVLGCSKKNQTTQPPAASTSITLDVSFPDGRSVTCTDYSMPVSPGSVSQEIDGSINSIIPVGSVNTNNVQQYGFNYWIFSFMGLTPGENYSLTFATPTQYDNTLFQETNGPYVSYTIAYTTGSNMKFQYQGSTYEMTSAIVTTAVSDSNSYNSVNGTFAISLYADSVFTATTRTAYSYSTPIVINGAFKNVTY
jgi:hypothetical protein